MKTSVADALEKRKNRNSFVSDKANVNAALESRKRKKQTNATEMLKGLRERFNQELNSFKSYKEPGYGSSFDEEYRRQSSSRSNINKLRRDIKANASYLGESAQEMLSGLDELEKGYKNYLDVADFRSAYANEEAYNYSKSQSEKVAKYSAMSDDELEAEIERLGGKENSFLSGIKKGFKTLALANMERDAVSSAAPDFAKNEILGKVEDVKSEDAEKNNDLSLLQQEKTKRKTKQLDTLPDDVKSLIDEYTELDTQKDYTNIENIGKGFANAFNQNAGGFSADSTAVRRKEIAEELESLGVENWQEMVEYNRIRTDGEKNKATNQQFKEAATEHPWLTSAATVLASPTKMLGAVEMLESTLTGSDAPLNYNSPYFVGNNFVNTTRETVMENYDWEGEKTNIDWFDQLYSTAMSTGDSLLNMALTGGSKMGSIVLGVGAMSDTAQSIAQQGGTKEQALLTGVFAGVNEMLWESVSIGNFQSLTEKGIKNLISKKGIKTLVANTLKSAGVNASEEFNTEAANIIVDYLVNGGVSSYGQAYNIYREGGYTDEQARLRARNDMVFQSLESGLGGALQGLFMGASGSVLGSSAAKNSYKAAAESYTAEDITALQNRARELGVDEKYINVENTSGGPWNNVDGETSQKKLAEFINKVDEAEAEAPKKDLIARAKTYGVKTDLFNTKTSVGFKTLADEVNKIESEISEKAEDLSTSIYTSAIKDRLVSLGENDSFASFAASSILKSYNNESLNQYEAAALNSKNAQKVYREYMASDSNEWVQTADERVSSAVYDLQNSYKVEAEKTTEKQSTDEKPVASRRAQTSFSSEVEINGSSAIVEGIGNITEDSATVVVGGNEVSVADVKFKDNKTQAAYEFASQMETTEKAQAALRLYNPHLDRTSDYKSAFDAYYNAGLKGIGTFEGADRYITYGEQFPKYWREDVFNAGRGAKSYTPGVNRFYQRQNLSANQKGQLDVLNAIGEKYGISFLVFDSLEDGGALNGMQIAGSNKIAIALNADGSLYLRTAGHECFHIIEEWNKQEAEKLINKVINYLKKSDTYDYDAQVEKYAKLYGVKAYTDEGRSLIHSEMAADCMFDVFSNEEFVTDLAKGNKSLLEKIKDFLNEFIADLRNMMKHFSDSPELTALREQKKVLEDINKSFITALETATQEMQKNLQNTQKNTASRTDVTEKAENDVQNTAQEEVGRKSVKIENTSIISNRDIKAAQLIGRNSINSLSSAELNTLSAFAQKYWNELGTKSPFFRAWFGDWRENDKTTVTVATKNDASRGVVSNTDTGWDINISGQVFNETNKQKSTSSVEAKPYLPYIRDIMKNAVLLDSYGVDPKKSDNSLLMHSFYAVADIGKGAEVLKVYVEEMYNPTTKNTNKRAYQLKNIEKAFTASVRVQGNSPSSLTNTVNAIKNVADLFVLVKQYDKNFTPKPASKIVTQDGTPKVMYHGTKADFTVFDRSLSTKKVHLNVLGDGNYFTERKSAAERYGNNIVNAYITIRNPYVFKNIQYNTVADQIAAEFGVDREGIKGNQVTTFLKSKGYDGVIIKDDGNVEMCNAFNSEQIKSATDNIGTFDENNPDIRYSLKLSSSAEKLLKSSPELQMVIQDLQQQTKLSHGYIPEAKRIHSYAYELKKTCESTLNVAEIEKDLRDIYEVLASMNGSEGYQYATELTYKLSEKLISNTKTLNIENAEKKELRQRLTAAVKGNKWYLSEPMRAEIENRYGSYGEFHKKIFGKGFYFSDTATNYLDSDWVGLCAELPELLDADTSAAEQPLVLLAAFDATEYEQGLVGEEYTQQTQYMAAEILNALSEIPAAETARDKISNENYKKIAALEAKNKERIAEIQEEHRNEFEHFKKQSETAYKLKMKRHIESQERAIVLKRVETQIVRLSGMLAKGTKNRHIPLKLIDSVRDLCYVLTLNPAAQNSLGENLQKIEASYAALTEGKDGPDGTPDNQFLMNAYDEYVHGLIQQLGTVLTHKTVGNMTLNELKLVDETVRAVTQRVNRANELHIESRNEGVEEAANSIGSELGSAKVKREFRQEWLNKASDKAENDAWKFLKPVYAWRMIGSDTFGEIMGNIRKGEDTWAVDMYEARLKITELAKKYHKNQWSTEKIEIELSSGTFNFSVQQLMMFYVAAQRQQYIPHLLGDKGGFVFEDAYRTVESIKDGEKAKPEPKLYRQRDAGTHALTEKDLEVLANALSEDQKGYADEMRDYLAKDLAVKGNSITRKLYDINKFTEDKYFPIKVAREFLDGTVKEPEVRSVLSTSIMKDLQKNAANPVLLRDFDVMWAEHVQQMAMFHSFALPLDDFQRVFNFRATKGESASIKTWIETSCGKGAVSYIENFIKDVNGGVRAQNGAELVNTMVSKFKKGAVFASASTTVQQGSAIARALAVVDAKYFNNPTITKKDYEELMKYAPIARVKSMGFFDTSVGQSTADWLTAAEYETKQEKLEAFFKDSSYRDEWLSKAPEIMDEITWCNIWHAVKNETAAKTKLTGEELLVKSGERFAEVVELTQVYDSVFSKSELMRSKDTGVKMVTAFMAEPTVSLNMLVDAAVQAKRGNRKGAGRFVGAFAFSVVLNNILKALVTAPRDDDEEKTLIEKYIAEVFNGTMQDLNPLTLIPMVKDVISIFQGYGVERADMSLVQNLYDAVTGLSSDKKSTYRKIEDIAGATAAFLGLPVKNLMRDFRGVLNTFKGLGTIDETSVTGIKEAIGADKDESFYNKYIQKWIFGTPEEQLYNAIKTHDYSAYEKLQKGEYGGDKVKTNEAIREGLKAYDERVTQAAQARLEKNSALYSKLVNSIKADGFSNENIIKAVNSVYDKLAEREEAEEPTEKAYSLYTNDDLMIALETGGDYITIIDDIIETAKENGKTTDEAEKSIRTNITKYWKPIYLEASESERATIREILDDTGLYKDIDDYCGDWVLSYLKDQYKAATTSSERASIRSLIWATGQYKSRANMDRVLKNSLEEDDEDNKE